MYLAHTFIHSHTRIKTHNKKLTQKGLIYGASHSIMSLQKKQNLGVFTFGCSTHIMYTHFCIRKSLKSTIFSQTRHSVQFLRKNAKKEYNVNGKSIGKSEVAIIKTNYVKKDRRGGHTIIMIH